METESKEKQIKIQCPEHDAVFEVEHNPKIICEIREHSISNDFPKGEFWEYCCDCRIFSRSKLDVGGVVKESCSNCERKTISRFICGNCKIVTFDSGKDTKGKVFSVSFDSKEINPSCPGCYEKKEADELFLHKCNETDIVFLTSRKTCPFCKKETNPKKVPSSSSIKELKCENCRATNPKDSPFCGSCGRQLLSNITDVKFGTSKAKTQLLGSICPTCGNPNESNSRFCPKCGQKLKESKQEQKTEEMTNVPPSLLNSKQDHKLDNTSEAKTPQESKSTTNVSGCLAAFGVIAGVIILCVVFNAIKNKEEQVSTRNDNAYNQSGNDNSGDLAFDANNKEDADDLDNTSDSEDELPNYFERTYRGRIGKFSLTIELKKDGNKLTGKASTSSNTDYLYGDINNSGSFTLEGHEGDIRQTGIYKGRINSDGSISGNWTKMNGRGKTYFSATQK